MGRPNPASRMDQQIAAGSGAPLPRLPAVTATFSHRREKVATLVAKRDQVQRFASNSG